MEFFVKQPIYFKVDGIGRIEMANVVISDLRKSFGDLEVIHGLRFEIIDGEFVVLVGPSGCGKSTLLRMIAGLEGISAGSVLIDGNVVNNLPPAKRDIAMVFQNYALYPHKTVAANMAFSLRMKGIAKVEITKRVNRAAEILGLIPYLDRYPRALSGGQRQRVAMGRAIVRDPQVFLFDEPLSNLDAKLRVQMRSEIKELHQRLNSTTVYVTHDQIEAMTMADKIVVMQDGCIEQIGNPLEVYDKPVNTFVAGFIGSPAMNMLEGQIMKGDSGLVVKIEDEQLPIPNYKNLLVGQNVIVGIRPENLLLADKGLAGNITVIEPTGSETQLVIRENSLEYVSIVRERLNYELNHRVYLTAEPDKIHLFDATSKTRII